MASSQKRSLSPESSSASAIKRSKIMNKESKTGYDTTMQRCLENYKTPYQSQFEELSIIGHGGFGDVVKARHLLDGNAYAVKKVCIKKQSCEKILDEVKILAKLHHPNVVGYNQAWVEPYNGTENLQYSQSSQSCSTASSDSLSTIRKGTESIKITSSKTISKDNGEPMVDGTALHSSQEEECRYVLYIQMRLCEQNLREWMDQRNKFRSLSKIEKISTQLLSGIHYIHSRRIIHHDINPRNIFISLGQKQFSVQLGDFGLACNCRKDKKLGEHSQEIGTSLYIAPEQLEKKCHPKSDIYSFGVVLFELLYPMKTAMERALQIKDAKNNNIPSDVKRRYTNWVPILKKALRADLTVRPSAGDLLNHINSIKSFEEEQRVIPRAESTTRRNTHT